jgi:hypothetical protein
METFMHRKALRAFLACLATAAAALGGAPFAQAQHVIVPSPAYPAYGDVVSIELRNAPLVILPATRFARNENTFTVDFEYSGNNFGPFSPSYGSMPLALGELAAGTYKIEARLFDDDRPGSGPTMATLNLQVAPPASWGIFPVPQAPRAFQDVSVLIHSAAYFDPRTMRASRVGRVVRVEFDYLTGHADADPVPPGMTTFAASPLGKLAPGVYQLEAWGRPASGNGFTRFFTREFTVRDDTIVVEYYHETLDHYFMAASADEIALLDGGGQGGWKRTGQHFGAWLKATDAPLNAHPVCRFYARGPNSHFYTGDDRECQMLRDLERDGRAQATAANPFLGWGFEGIAFWALLPQYGECLAASTPVYRAYNQRAAQGDSNHRFMADPALRGTMAGWADEGAVFCSVN